MALYASIYSGPPRGYTATRTRKRYIAIHNTANDATAEQEASYATRRTDSTSSHYYVDDSAIVQSLDTDFRAWHAGSPEGNDHAISYEITGVNGWTRAQWLDRVAWDLLAAQIRRDCAEHGITPRHLSVAQIRAGSMTGIITHNDMRLAWGGTTHTDPGPNFPMDHLIRLVTEEDDMPTAQEIARAVRNELTVVTTEQHWSVRAKLHPAGKTIDPATGIELGWGYAKAAWRLLPELASAAELAELRGQVAGLTALVTQALAGGPAPLTAEQLQQLTEAVTAAAREPGERIAQQLAAASRAVAELEDDQPEP